jgi:hypothetical protein
MSREILSRLPCGPQNNTAEQVLATIPQRHGDTVLEIALVHDGDGATTIELRSLVWGHDLGWYRQHTLELDGTTARPLIQALGVIQRREERQASDTLARKVLPFPHRRHPDASTT